MKRLFPLSAAVAAGVGIFFLATAVFADPINPNFETGNTNGWEAEEAGDGPLEDEETDGEIDVVDECEDCDTPFSPYTAQSGNFFALLIAGQEDEFTSLTQTFQVPAGSVVSGWYFFCNDEEGGENEGDDPSSCPSSENGDVESGALRSADVTLTDRYCDKLRIAYRVNEGPANEAVGLNACEHFSTDWTEFEVVVPGPRCQPVEFELFAGVSNFDDSAAPSAMGLDNIQVDDSHCVTQRPNIGAGLSGLFQGQPTPLPTAPSAVAPAATAPTISPPRTGDAGLADESSATLYGVAAAGFVLAVLSVRRLVRR